MESPPTVSMTILSTSFSLPLQNSEMNTAAPRPSGTASTIANAVTGERSDQQGQDAVFRPNFRRWLPARAGEELDQVQPPVDHHRRGFAKDEEEDREDKEDRAPAAEPNDPLDHGLGAVRKELHHAPQQASVVRASGGRCGGVTHVAWRAHSPTRSRFAVLRATGSSRGSPSSRRPARRWSKFAVAG